MWTISILILLQLVFNFASCKFCCDHEFQIEREYCEPLASTFEFRVLGLQRKSADLIEYNVEVTRNYRGIFQAHTRSVLMAARHYCVPEIKLHPNRYYLAITRSLRISAFMVDNCFFEQTQFAWPKVRARQLLCMSYDTNSSFQLPVPSFISLLLIWMIAYFQENSVSFIARLCN